MSYHFHVFAIQTSLLSLHNEVMYIFFVHFKFVTFDVIIKFFTMKRGLSFLETSFCTFHNNNYYFCGIFGSGRWWDNKVP
jgi:hypothetical protein